MLVGTGKCGTTSGANFWNGSTTITPSAYSFNSATGQEVSIVKYTGNATSGAQTVAHGLGIAIPGMGYG